jgi:hypothetical protein
MRRTNFISLTVVQVTWTVLEHQLLLLRTLSLGTSFIACIIAYVILNTFLLYLILHSNNVDIYEPIFTPVCDISGG